MTTVAYAVGEVQELDKPADLHAVADGRPGTWGHSICSEGAKVWVHEVGGEVLPFPGLWGGRACPECVHLVEKATPPSRVSEKRSRPPRRFRRPT